MIEPVAFAYILSQINMDPRRILEDIDACFETALRHGLGKKGLTFPIDPSAIDDLDLKDCCDRLASIFEMINESYHYALRLAEGDLKAQVSRRNIFAMPLKGLQASLAHLTWQANQVAEGDLNQRVQFLGEFSDAFNHMIESLREKQVLEQRFSLITNVIGEGIFLVDSDGRILFSNPEANRLLGYRSDEIAKVLIHETVCKQQPDGCYYKKEENPLLGAITEGENYSNNDGVFSCKSGKMLPVMVASRPVYKGEKLNGAVVAFRDITSEKEHLRSLETINELLEKQATTDALTGIFNRMKFNKVLTFEMKRSERYHCPLSLILFDIDHFKHVNDQYGHHAGDRVLVRMTKLVSANMRQTDIFARWGGEEFVILTPGITLEQSVIVANKARRKIETYDFENPSRVTASFGVAEYQAGDNSTSLINRADDALYRAKEAGRNQVMAGGKA